jgi:hypothetical protein
MKEKIIVLLNNEELTLDSMYISELGYLMCRVFSEKTKTYKTYNMGVFDKKNNFFTEMFCQTKNNN